MVDELQGAKFAEFSKLRHPSWSTTAELEASVEPRNDVIVGPLPTQRSNNNISRNDIGRKGLHLNMKEVNKLGSNIAAKLTSIWFFNN